MHTTKKPHKFKPTVVAIGHSPMPKVGKYASRPKANTTKEPVKLRLDADVLAALRATGDGWQTRINETLRASLRLAGRV
jgi:uncharacterized protein (DUF4415 family)